MSNRFLVITRGEDGGIIPEWSVSAFHESIVDKSLFITYREEGNVTDSPSPFIEDYLVNHITSMPGVSSPQGKGLTVVCSWLGTDGTILKDCIYEDVSIKGITPGYFDYGKDERYIITTEMRYGTRRVVYPKLKEDKENGIV